MVVAGIFGCWDHRKVSDELDYKVILCISCVWQWADSNRYGKDHQNRSVQILVIHIVGTSWGGDCSTPWNWIILTLTYPLSFGASYFKEFCNLILLSKQGDFAHFKLSSVSFSYITRTVTNVFPLHFACIIHDLIDLLIRCFCREYPASCFSGTLKGFSALIIAVAERKSST